MMPFSPVAISEKNAVLPGNRFREFDGVFAAKRCGFGLSFLFELLSFDESFECLQI